MKTRTYANLLTVVALTALCAPVVRAQVFVSPIMPPPLVISYDASGQEVTITHDGKGVYRFEGLPYPGDVLYTPENGVVYYQHPDDPVWYSITPAMLTDQMAKATISKGPAGKPWQKKAVWRWNVTAPQSRAEANPDSPLAADVAQAPLKDAACPPIFGSKDAAAMTRLNVADLEHVLVALQWLNGGTVVNTCEKLAFKAEEAQAIGLPTLFTGPNGPWTLQTVVQGSFPQVTLPSALPVDDATRLRFLLIQFGPEDRAALVRKYGDLPIRQQIERISPLLTADTIVP